VCTSWCDDTIGETIAGSTGIPSGYYAQTALQIGQAGSDLKHVRISHAFLGLVYDYDSAPAHTLSHSAFINCGHGLSLNDSTLFARNILMIGVRTNFIASFQECTAHVEHLTASKAAQFKITGSFAVFDLNVTNSIFVAITNFAAFSGANNATNSDPALVFQTVGAGTAYLLDDTYRNSGTTSITPSLLTEIRRMVTWPPVIYSNMTIGNTNLIITPQGERDEGLPALGYHYPALDAVFGTVYFTNSAILLTNGAAIGTFSATSSSYAMGLGDNARFFSEGQPTNLNRIVRYNTVQEQANANWSTYRHPSIFVAPVSVTTAPQARFRFTGWSSPARDVEHFRDYKSGGVDVAVPFIDCQFAGGSIYSERAQLNVTNCLFQRVALTLNGIDYPLNPSFRHNTFVGGTNHFVQEAEGAWTFKDNLFDGTGIYTNITGFTHNYNAYTTNLARLLPHGANDVILTVSNVTYETGPLGHYYLPSTSALTNKGSGNATNVGLYHFT
jgi:hypothetical protein